MRVQSFDFSINVLKSLLWRHNDAVNLQALVQYKQDALDSLNKDFWESWVEDVFNIDTANDFGLAVWSIILNLPVTISNSGGEDDNSNFGFGPFRKNFNNGNFTKLGGTISLSTEDARTVLKLRYYQMVCRPTVTEINKILKELFGNSHVLDGLDMTMVYILDSDLGSPLQTFISEYDILPRPSAVELKILTNPNSAFGFGSFRKNFNNGNFRR